MECQIFIYAKNIRYRFLIIVGSYNYLTQMILSIILDAKYCIGKIEIVKNRKKVGNLL